LDTLARLDTRLDFL